MSKPLVADTTVDISDLDQLRCDLEVSIRQTLVTRLHILWEQQNPGKKVSDQRDPLTFTLDTSIISKIAGELSRNTLQSILDYEPRRDE